MDCEPCNGRKVCRPKVVNASAMTSIPTIVSRADTIAQRVPWDVVVAWPLSSLTGIPGGRVGGGLGAGGGGVARVSQEGKDGREVCNIIFVLS